MSQSGVTRRLPPMRYESAFFQFCGRVKLNAGVVAKLTVMAAKVAQMGPDRPPPVIMMPLSDLADIIRITNENILHARRDFKILAHTASASLPFVTRNDLLDAAVQYRHALSLTEAFPFQ